MSPVSTKICKLCGEGFRGTSTPEEVHCAKCFVKTCDVPADTEEQFLKLVTEIHGPELAIVPKQPLPTAAIMPMIKDLLNHKARLAKLDSDVEKSNKTTKEKNRVKREIHRLRKEKDAMDGLMDGVKAKMMHLALMTSAPSSPNSPVSEPVTPVMTKGNSVQPKRSPAKSSAANTPQSPPKVPTNTPTTTPKAPTNTPTTPSSTGLKAVKSVDANSNGPLSIPSSPATPNSPPRSPLKQTLQQQQAVSTPVTSKSPNTESPVKRTALKFEAAAKKVNNVVTFAKCPAKTKPSRAPEVNNNDTPVTASSSSGEEDYDEGQENGNGGGLTRSNSVRDRIKAFEEIQRRASTGSYDRKKNQQGVKTSRTLSTMKGINA